MYTYIYIYIYICIYKQTCRPQKWHVHGSGPRALAPGSAARAAATGGREKKTRGRMTYVIV